VTQVQKVSQSSRREIKAKQDISNQC